METTVGKRPVGGLGRDTGRISFLGMEGFGGVAQYGTSGTWTVLDLEKRLAAY